MRLPMILITAGSLCSLAATDLVLPAIPVLPTVMTGTATQAQWVLIAFVIGISLGLVAFGELGARCKTITLLTTALVCFSILSLLATFTHSLVQLSCIRFFQGIFASASAVYAPVIIKQLYADNKAVAMIGRISSIEAVAPAIAPIFGVMLLSAFGWQSSFYLLAVLSALLAVLWQSQPQLKHKLERSQEHKQNRDGYWQLLSNRQYLKYALSQACTTGALLIVVFSAPKIMISSLHGTIADFIVMQIGGITLFILAANMTQQFERWWGGEKVILIGSALTTVGCSAILLLALFEQKAIPLLWLSFLFVNLGLGIRGPVGFYKALLASEGNDTRGSALVILLILFICAVGTAIIAPHIEDGLLHLGTVSTLAALSSVVILLILPAKAPIHAEV